MQMMTDFHACSWPEPLNATDTSLAACFDKMNDEPVTDAVAAINAQTDSQGSCQAVITFSHFLPLQVPFENGKIIASKPSVSNLSCNTKMERLCEIINQCICLHVHVYVYECSTA